MQEGCCQCESSVRESESQTPQICQGNIETQTEEDVADGVECSTQTDLLKLDDAAQLEKQLESLNQEHKVLIEQLENELAEANHRIAELQSQTQPPESPTRSTPWTMKEQISPEEEDIELSLEGPQSSNIYTQTQ